LTGLNPLRIILIMPRKNSVKVFLENSIYHIYNRGVDKRIVFDDYFDCEELELIGSDVEFGKYKFKRTKEGQINKREPLKMDDHGMDCDRYAISSSIPYFRELFFPFEEDISGGFWG